MAVPYSPEIAALVANINLANKDFGTAIGADATSVCQKLQAEARQLLNALEEPNTEINVSAALEVVSKMCLWPKFEGGKTLSLAEAVQATVRVFRQVTAVGVLADIPGPGYSLTTIGQPYFNPDHRAFNSFLFQEIIPSIKSHFIVQDFASTFAAIPTPPSGIEFMAHDMFTPQLVKNAYIYHYRHTFHEWNDQDDSNFLQQLMPLLKEQPRNKLLLADLVLPDTRCSMQETVRDFSVFPGGALESNEGQWRELLGKNGLRIKKIWRGSKLEACVGCEVAEGTPFGFDKLDRRAEK